MAQMAAYLVERVIPWVPTRYWVYLLNNPGLKTHALAGCHNRRQLA